MQITLEIPDQFVQSLVPNGRDLARTVLEDAVAEAYREQRLTTEQVRLLLGLGTRMQASAFLQDRGIFDYTEAEFEKDMLTLGRLFPSDKEKLRA